jgi:hypothetical protein
MTMRLKSVVRGWVIKCAVDGTFGARINDNWANRSYLLDRRQPAASASSSEQNHRLPLPVSILTVL